MATFQLLVAGQESGTDLTLVFNLDAKEILSSFLGICLAPYQWFFLCCLSFFLLGQHEFDNDSLC